MADIIFVELKKIFLFKRSQIALLFFSFISPIIAFLIITESNLVSIAGRFDYYSFGLTIWSLLKLTLVIYLLVIYFTSSNLGKELETGVIDMYLVRINRSSYYNAKLIACFCFWSITIILFIISSYFSFLLLNGTEFSISGGKMSYSPELYRYILWINILEIYFIITLTHFLSVILKNIGSFSVIVLTVILDRVLNNRLINDYSPYSISDVTTILDNSVVSYRYLAIILGYIIVFYILGIVFFKKIDIKHY